MGQQWHLWIGHSDGNGWKFHTDSDSDTNPIPNPISDSNPEPDSISYTDWIELFGNGILRVEFRKR